jgi:hypothetical protein
VGGYRLLCADAFQDRGLGDRGGHGCSARSVRESGERAHGAPPKPCTDAFPDTATKTVGRTTWYNRQRSVEYVVCDGFGLRPSADFPITADFVCALVSQAVGAKAERLSLFIDGACSADAITSDPKEPATYLSVACSWASDLLEKVAAPAGVLAGLGCAAAPVVGNSLGNLLESKHELDVAADIIGKGKCLKYSPTHFGSPWLAVVCGSKDPGFADLPQKLGTISVCAPPHSFAFGDIFVVSARNMTCAATVQEERTLQNGTEVTKTRRGFACRSLDRNRMRWRCTKGNRSYMWVYGA